MILATHGMFGCVDIAVWLVNSYTICFLSLSN